MGEEDASPPSRAVDRFPPVLPVVGGWFDSPTALVLHAGPCSIHLESGGPQATNLMQGNVGFVPLEQCRVDLNEPNLDEGQMCALGTGYPPLGTDTCQGDSGGPMIKYSTTRRDEVPEQVGIVSWGDGCGQSTPGAYTSVSYYNGWINSYLRAWEKMGHVVRGDETGRGQRID